MFIQRTLVEPGRKVLLSVAGPTDVTFSVNPDGDPMVYVYIHVDGWIMSFKGDVGSRGPLKATVKTLFYIEVENRTGTYAIAPSIAIETSGQIRLR